jgi:hypothetical protein
VHADRLDALFAEKAARRVQNSLAVFYRVTP